MTIEGASSTTASHSGGCKAYLAGNGHLRALTLEPQPLLLSSALGRKGFLPLPKSHRGCGGNMQWGPAKTLRARSTEKPQHDIRVG